jgi:5'-3' exonuclease
MEKAMKTSILIVDTNNLAHRVYHSMSRLGDVAIIYGLPVMVGSLIKQFNPKRTYLVWDGKKSEHRLKLLPTYKERKKHSNFDAEDFYYQRDVVMKIFRALGVKQIHGLKYESDDLIYSLVRKFKGKRIVIASNDKDFHQLINDKVHVYNAKDITLTAENLRLHFDYTPTQCIDYLCLVGDDSDKIKGYPGIGPAKAAQFFKEHSSISSFLQSTNSFKHIDKTKLELLYAINRQLIDLQFYHEKFILNHPMPFYKKDRVPVLDKKTLYKICDNFTINHFRKSSFLKIWKTLT